MIDTTTLTNGLHTISWTVTDNLGITEGIGSRFFTVSNGAGAVTAAENGGPCGSGARAPRGRRRHRGGAAGRRAGAGAPRVGPRGAVAMVRRRAAPGAR